MKFGITIRKEGFRTHSILSDLDNFHLGYKKLYLLSQLKYQLALNLLFFKIIISYQFNSSIFCKEDGGAEDSNHYIQRKLLAVVRRRARRRKV